MNQNGIYPWQREQWEMLHSRLRASALPHALLLHGEQGTGIDHFAEHLIRTLLCLAEEKPCGCCRTCRLYASGNHPDFLAVAPEREGGDIKINQVRALADYLQTARHYGKCKVVWMESADTMNRAAANGLLKTLEEPPSNTLVVLTSHFPFRMPATVRSRCQTVRLNCHDRAQARKWLSEVEGIGEDEATQRLAAHRWRPLHAMNVPSNNVTQAGDRESFFQDMDSLCARRTTLVEIAEKWHTQPTLQVQRWLLELVETAIVQQVKSPSPEISLPKLFSFYDRQKYRYLSQKIRFDSRLLIEGALVEWQSVYPGRVDKLKYG